MILKEGSRGEGVKKLQTSLNLKADGVFGPNTKTKVIEFQLNNQLTPDGIVGRKTWEVIGLDTDQTGIITDTEYVTTNGLTINKKYLNDTEYVQDYGEIEPRGFFIHHTAGWNNPYEVVRSWNNDTRGRVATQYVIGGSNVRKKSSKYDGVVVECFPNNYLGWHLGKVGNFNISKFSGGIELNNFGYLKEKNGKFYTYVNVEVNKEHVCDLGYEFRGYRYWHSYTDSQIESLRLLLLHIKEIYPKADITNGLPKLLNDGVDPKTAFEFNDDAYYAKQFGLWTHTNVRKDKFDCFPQPELVEMLKTFNK
tara:strand:+ start:385 stop:1308 length:924 start_codon:yes stop_codon:yes gene_type:complete